jgi:hypothetical protein
MIRSPKAAVPMVPVRATTKDSVGSRRVSLTMGRETVFEVSPAAKLTEPVNPAKSSVRSPER